MGEQLALAWDAPTDDRWTYRRGMPDRSGLAAYLHLVRWRHDPPETVARGAAARASGLRAPGAAKRTGGTVEEARSAIAALLADREPRTFHCIAVQLAGVAADALEGSPLERALWAMCADGTLAWACEDGCVFWTLAELVEWGEPGRAAA